MQLLPLISLASTAAAQTANAAFSAAYESYVSSLEAEPAFSSAILALTTNRPLAAIPAFLTVVPDAADLTAPPSFITALPDSVQPLFESFYTHEVSLARQYGVLPATESEAETHSGSVSSGSLETGSVTGSVTGFGNGSAAATSGPSAAKTSDIVIEGSSGSSGAGVPGVPGPTASAGSGHTSGASSNGFVGMGVAVVFVGGVVALL